MRSISVPAAPRWAVWIAHAVALTTVPSALWRIGVALGFPLGYTEAGLEKIRGDSWEGPAWLVFLSVATEVAAFLTVGLVQSWPLVRRVGHRVAARLAWAGVAILTVLWTPFLLWWTMPHDDMTETGAFLLGFVYLPLVAWAPLLAAITLNFQRRHRSAP